MAVTPEVPAPVGVHNRLAPWPLVHGSFEDVHPWGRLLQEKVTNPPVSSQLIPTWNVEEDPTSTETGEAVGVWMERGTGETVYWMVFVCSVAQGLQEPSDCVSWVAAYAEKVPV